MDRETETFLISAMILANIFIQEMEMSLMCPMEGCKQKPGMCIHEKMMLGMMVAMLAAAAFWLL